MAPPSAGSSLAQRPRTYQPVSVPSSAVPRTSTSSHVPSGVVAFHEAMSSVSENGGVTTGEVQVAVS
jgi:hypothetical protein